MLLWHVLFFDRNLTGCLYSDTEASAVLIRLDLLYLGQKQSMQKATHYCAGCGESGGIIILLISVMKIAAQQMKFGRRECENQCFQKEA